MLSDLEEDQKPHLASTLVIFILKVKQPVERKEIQGSVNTALVQILETTPRQISMELIASRSLKMDLN